MGDTSRATPTLRATTYQAAQWGTTAMIRAQVEHLSTGYQVIFEQSPLRIFLPQFVLRHVAPPRIIASVVTP